MERIGIQKLKLLALLRLATFALNCSAVAYRLFRVLQAKAQTLAARLLANV